MRKTLIFCALLLLIRKEICNNFSWLRFINKLTFRRHCKNLVFQRNACKTIIQFMHEVEFNNILRFAWVNRWLILIYECESSKRCGSSCFLNRLSRACGFCNVPRTSRFRHRKQSAPAKKAFAKLLAKAFPSHQNNFHIQQQCAQRFYHVKESSIHFTLPYCFGLLETKSVEKPWWWLNKFSLWNGHELRNQFQFA